MSDRHSNIAGTRMLIIGASSGIGQALALAAHSQGAAVALAARRVDRLSELADRLGGSAHELDVSDPRAIESVVNAVAAHFGKLDAVVFTSAVVPFALIEDTDVETWLHAYAVNAVGASHVLRTALPTWPTTPRSSSRRATTWGARVRVWRPTMRARPRSTRSYAAGGPNTPRSP